MDRFCHLFFDTYSLAELQGFSARVREAAGGAARSLRFVRAGVRLNPFRRMSARLPRHARISLVLPEKRGELWLPGAWNGRLLVALAPRRELFAAPDNTSLIQGYMKKALANGFAVIGGEAYPETLLKAGREFCKGVYGEPPVRVYLRGDAFRLLPGFDGTFFPELGDGDELRLRFLVREGGTEKSCLLPFFAGEEELSDTACMTLLLNWAEEGVSPESI